jgi:hypothetical protein
MTAAAILRLNGDLRNPKDSGMMEVVRRFHALAQERGLPYCVVGGMAVIRNGYPRTTEDVDILTYKKNWQRIMPLEGEIQSSPDAFGFESAMDKATGVTIDILFSDADWDMVIPMPDPIKVGEFDAELGANFISLHDLVQLKTAVYISKLQESGPDVAAKDQSDVYELISRNLTKFSKEIINTYDPVGAKNSKRITSRVVFASEQSELSKTNGRIPPQGKHLLRRYGLYSSRSRGTPLGVMSVRPRSIRRKR